MNDAFAEKVYPTILYVLDLLDRIRDRRGGEPEPAAEQPRLKQKLGQVDSRGADQQDCELAKKALVYWIDEMLIHSTWRHREVWRTKFKLEGDYYRKFDHAVDFFYESQKAKSLSRSDALEVYYLAAALGFVGDYPASRGGRQAPSNQPMRMDGPAHSNTEWRGPTAPAPSNPAPRAPAPPANPANQGANFGVTWGAAAAPEDDPSWNRPLTPVPKRAGPGNDPQILGQGLGRAEAIRPAASFDRQDLARAVREWADPVFAQIFRGGPRPFAPTVAPDSQRDAAPHSGAAAWKWSISWLAWVSLFGIVLGAYLLIFMKK